jgi:hypothetical protein
MMIAMSDNIRKLGIALNLQCLFSYNVVFVVLQNIKNIFIIKALVGYRHRRRQSRRYIPSPRSRPQLPDAIQAHTYL